MAILKYFASDQRAHALRAGWRLAIRYQCVIRLFGNHFSAEGVRKCVCVCILYDAGSKPKRTRMQHKKIKYV